MNNFFIRDNDTQVHHINDKSDIDNTSHSNTTNTYPYAETIYPATGSTSEFVPLPTPSSLSTAKTSSFSRSVYHNNSNSNSSSTITTTTTTNNNNSNNNNSRDSCDQITSGLSNSTFTSASSASSTLASATVKLTTSHPPSATTFSKLSLTETFPNTNPLFSASPQQLPHSIYSSGYMGKEGNSSEHHAYKEDTFYQERQQQQQLELNEGLQFQPSTYQHFDRDNNDNNLQRHSQHAAHISRRQHPSLDSYAQQKYTYNNVQRSNHYHNQKQHDHNSSNKNDDNYLCYSSKPVAPTETSSNYATPFLYTSYSQNQSSISDDTFHSFTTNAAREEHLENVPVISTSLSTTATNNINDTTVSESISPSFAYPSTLSTQVPLRNTSHLHYDSTQTRNAEFFDYSTHSQTQYYQQTTPVPRGQSNVTRTYDVPYQPSTTERSKQQTALYTDPTFQPPSRLCVSQGQARQQIVKSSVPWTYKESKQLMRLREKGLTWKQISQSFKNRTLNACQFKWKRIIMNGGIEFSDDEEGNDDENSNDENDETGDDSTLKEEQEIVKKLPHGLVSAKSDSSSVGMKRSSESEAEETELKRSKIGVSLSQIYNSSGSVPLRYTVNHPLHVRQSIPGNVFASESSFSSGPSNTEIETTRDDQNQDQEQHSDQELEQEKEHSFFDFTNL